MIKESSFQEGKVTKYSWTQHWSLKIYHAILTRLKIMGNNNSCGC